MLPLFPALVPRPASLHCLSFRCFACSKLYQLESLELCGGSITDNGVSHLANLTKLKSLSLAQNSRISDISLLVLSNLSDLTTLNLTQSRVTGNGILTLQSLTVSLSPHSGSLLACFRKKLHFTR